MQMPRPTKPERMNNAIRQLRCILANPLNNKPLTQDELAKITDVPLDSLRGIECGRQALSARMLNRIRCETGAAWNEQDHRWRFWKSDGATYRREHYLKFRELIGRDVEKARPLDIFLAALRIKLLMETLSPEAQFKFNFRLNSFLEKNRKEFCPDQFAELFEDASSYIEAHPELDRDHPLLVFRRYPPRLAAVLTAIARGAIHWFATKLNPSDYEIIKQPQRAPHVKKKQKPAAVSSSGE
jgi:transcriptional regulator with XRE-family HTH domain